MKKVVNVFVLAVFLPSLILAYLAIRSLRDQQFVVERQQSLLYQSVADAMAKDAETLLMEKQHEFNAEVEALVRKHEGAHLAKLFDQEIRTHWPLADVGFVVTMKGDLLSPTPNSRPEAQLFCAANSQFLGNQQIAEVYWNSKNPVQSEIEVQQESAFNSLNNSSESYRKSSSKQEQSSSLTKNSYSNKGQQRAVVPQQLLNNAPAQMKMEDKDLNVSKVMPSETEFRQLIGDAREGTLARFVNDKLSVLVWCRPEREPKMIFGAQLSLSILAEELKSLVQKVDPALAGEICVAVVNDKARPVVTTNPGFQPNWKHPFAATEIGEALPHWEIAVYLLNPAKLADSARRVTVFLGILIAILVLGIAMGSAQIFSDLKRQELLARQKSDFVSNVSHELKTPLTSIRMFSEMLADGRVIEPEKQRSYLNIITAEAARLTRLINNVLDFSRMERGEKKYELVSCDFANVVAETTESYRPHLESNGFQLRVMLPTTPSLVSGDRDALAQILVNLLSNAEKYSDGSKEIEVELRTIYNFAELKVLDRGKGVPRGSEEKIFEQFYRANDSLSSGIQGSGLGLTLARQIAKAHGGNVTYERREGGGSCFTLRVPITSSATIK